MKQKLFLLSLILLSGKLFGQMIEPVTWSFDSKQNGQEMELIYTATIEDGWHLYDISLPDGGPIPTSFKYTDASKFELIGEMTKTPAPTKVHDETFQMDLHYYSHQVVLKQKIRLKEKISILKGVVEFMSCNDETCSPPTEVEFSFKVSPFEVAEAKTQVAETTVPDKKTEIGKDQPVTQPTVQSTQKEVKPEVTSTTTEKSNNTSSQTIWLFLVISFLAGLAAVVTPCVFPMIPMTVSFFMRGSDNRKKAVTTGIFFGVSIVFIYTLLGALFSIGVFGPNVGNILSTHWIPNTLFFILFLVFALSFFGAFEIILPSSLVNKTDAKADQGGLVGAFFMALTTVIVSFSCTGPFIGALIIEAVQAGGMRPLLGMFVFGLAFATPFTLLAIFPSALKKLPKSGGWLNVIKVVFAFILLAFGLKFLSNIDQVYGLNLLSREIYLAIWVVIFFLLGMYFLGKIKFSHDSEIPFVSVGRLILAIITFTFTLYLFTGLFGAPLKSISSLIPPPSQQTTFVNNSGNQSAPHQQALCGPAKYADVLHLPQGLAGYFEFEEGMKCAKEQGKPAFVVFKGHACANCKKMENSVWTDPEVLRLLSEKYVIIGLYTDDRTKLPEAEIYVSKVDGKEKDTMGKKNLDILIGRYQTNSIPYHAIIKPDGTEQRLGTTFDTEEFRKFIQEGAN